eukprot:COSAG04_NODE_25422_length_307_cov_1.947115_1_plen_60_part_10
MPPTHSGAVSGRHVFVSLGRAAVRRSQSLSAGLGRVSLASSFRILGACASFSCWASLSAA